MRLRANPAAVPSSKAQPKMVFGSPTGTVANLSKRARAYLETIKANDPDADEELGRAIWYHALAIIYAPAYLTEHGPAVRAAWPRIPLPATLEQLKQSVALGKEIAALVDVEKPVLGVTTGKLKAELSSIGRISGPTTGISLEVTAGWGNLQEEAIVVMPGKGLLKRRDVSSDEMEAIAAGAESLGMTVDALRKLWGDKTVDVYLNQQNYWSNVPLAVWEYTIGGYQALKKWLSYRESAILGRALTKDEAREFTHIVRRVAALIALEPALNDNYQKTVEGSYAWPASMPSPASGVAVTSPI
jgi:hypothetical protein